jgi:hypothetical protein
VYYFLSSKHRNRQLCAEGARAGARKIQNCCRHVVIPTSSFRSNLDKQAQQQSTTLKGHIRTHKRFTNIHPTKTPSPRRFTLRAAFIKKKRLRSPRPSGWFTIDHYFTINTHSSLFCEHYLSAYYYFISPQVQQ